MRLKEWRPYIAILLPFLCWSCSKAPSDILSEKEMQRVMTDVYLAEAMIGIDYNAYKSDSMKQALYESVFRKHGITQALYDSSMVWYGKNMDIFMGSILAGENAEAPSPFDFALGGAGMNASCPLGANGTLLKDGMAVMVDMAGNYSPYMTDMTRVFSVGTLSDDAYRAHQVSIHIHDEIARVARPGTACADLYHLALRIATDEGLAPNFMGTKQQAKFVGHGVGLQINELPVLTPRSKEVLEEHMVFALEPKFVLPGIGAVGIENTYLVTSQGVEKLTNAPEEVIRLDA